MMHRGEKMIQKHVRNEKDVSVLVEIEV